MMDPTEWTVTHNGNSVTANNLADAVLEARKLRTPEEDAEALKNIIEAMEEQEPDEELLLAQQAASQFSKIRKMLNAIYLVEE